MKINKKAFTLVELLVVVVILGILSTIWFISYSWYQSWVRDANRIAQMKEIQKWLEWIKIRWKLPLPDETRINILLNWELVAYQWYAWEKVLWALWYSWEWVDPKDGTYFTYYTTKNRKYFQLMSFLEEDPTQISFVWNKLKAIDYSKRLPYVVWDNLWMLTDENNNPIQEVETTQINIKSDLTSLLKSHFRWTEYVSWTWSKYVEFKKLLKIDKVWGKKWGIIENNFCEIWNPCCMVADKYFALVKDNIWNQTQYYIKCQLGLPTWSKWQALKSPVLPNWVPQKSLKWANCSWANCSSFGSPVWNNTRQNYDYPLGKTEDDYPLFKNCANLWWWWKVPTKNDLLTILTNPGINSGRVVDGHWHYWESSYLNSIYYNSNYWSANGAGRYATYFHFATGRVYGHTKGYSYRSICVHD